MTQQQTITPADYETVRAAIAYLSESWPDETDLPRFARALGLTERQLTDLFRRWCGLTPKSFAQAVALDHAKKLLADSRACSTPPTRSGCPRPRGCTTCSSPTRPCRPAPSAPKAKASR